MKELPFFRHNVTIGHIMLEETAKYRKQSLFRILAKRRKRFYGSYNQRKS